MSAQLGFCAGECGTPQHELLASMSLWTMDFPTQFALVSSLGMSINSSHSRASSHHRTHAVRELPQGTRVRLREQRHRS